ncbi:MAG: hypothetical protein QGI47_08465 [Candidatus Marinimicrobia bacterium]|jgi:hypothetical protein|nr:hypothetical protein [Candidatus Neomarinimicrobiota bacterium]
MKNYNKLLSLLITVALVYWGCEEPIEQEDETIPLRNSLNDPDMGDVGSLSGYFFNFANGFNIKYNRYDANSINNPDLFDPEEDTLNFRSYAAYTLENGESNLTGYEVITPEMIADSGYADLTPIDSLRKNSVSNDNKVTFNSEKLTNINGLNWDYGYERYQATTQVEPSVAYDSTFVDILDSLYQEAVVDTADTTAEGIMFIDRYERAERSESMSSRDTVMVHYFEFTQKIFGLDSLVFKENTDCNSNGIWDDAEEIVTDASGCPEGTVFIEINDTTKFCDRGNGLWDGAEVYYDKNGDSTFTGDEPLEDRNCNGIWDEVEEKLNDINGDGDSTDVINGVKEFIDRGNGKYDFAEEFIDKNNNAEYDSDDELLKFREDERPANFLVSYDNYPDLNEPRELLNVYPGDSLLTRFGIVYRDLIKEITITDTVTREIENIDSVITLYTNKIITVTDEEFTTSNSYNIAKAEWNGIDPATSADIREYDYHFFRQGESEGHIYQLIHPSYFKHYGYHDNIDDIINGSPLAFTDEENKFWYETFARGDILFYSVGNNLRDGELVETDTTMVTQFGDYHIEESYAVNTDTISIAGTTYPCFRVTRIMTMTLLGNGVEYGERNVSWLADGIGVVKDAVYTRWSEPFWSSGEDWELFSVLELAEFRPLAKQANLGKMVTQQNTIKFDDLEHVAEFDNDPYRISRKIGIQRIGQPVLQEDF